MLSKDIQKSQLKYGYTDSWSDYHDYLQVMDNINEDERENKHDS